jgi:hypothetical protein
MVLSEGLRVGLASRLRSEFYEAAGESSGRVNE